MTQSSFNVSDPSDLSAHRDVFCVSVFKPMGWVEYGKDASDRQKKTPTQLSFVADNVYKKILENKELYIFANCVNSIAEKEHHARVVDCTDAKAVIVYHKVALQKMLELNKDIVNEMFESQNVATVSKINDGAIYNFLMLVSDSFKYRFTDSKHFALICACFSDSVEFSFAIGDDKDLVKLTKSISSFWDKLGGNGMDYDILEKLIEHRQEAMKKSLNLKNHSLFTQSIENNNAGNEPMQIASPKSPRRNA